MMVILNWHTSQLFSGRKKVIQDNLKLFQLGGYLLCRQPASVHRATSQKSDSGKVVAKASRRIAEPATQAGVEEQCIFVEVDENAWFASSGGEGPSIGLERLVARFAAYVKGDREVVLADMLLNSFPQVRIEEEKALGF
jgi:hypothetical protein